MKPQNIILIMTDTQGANVVGAYEDQPLETPRIDELAAKGARFERAYTTSPLCTAARAGLLTGIYSNLAGPWANHLAFANNVKTIGERLQDQGYRTAHIGKWHLDGHDYFGTGICPPGWDAEHWYDIRNYLDELTEQEAMLWRQGLPDIDALRQHDIKPAFTMAHRVSERAIRFLEEPATQPFLLVVSYDEPHHPHTCPPEYAEKFSDFEYAVGPGAADDLSDKPRHHQVWADIYSPKVLSSLRDGEYWHDPLYFGCNSFVDHEIGRVLDAAYQHAPQDTTIIYTSDHGAMIGAHQLNDKGPAMYEEITRIPLIVASLNDADQPTICDDVVSHIDIVPTILELAGLAQPPIMPGRSLMPFIRGESDPESEAIIEFNRFILENEFLGGLQPIRCLAGPRYKLVINLFQTDELYDLQDDPAELHNLIGDPAYATIRNEMHDRLLARMNSMQDPFEGAIWEERPWRDTANYPWGGRGSKLGDSVARLHSGYGPEVRAYLTGQPYTK